MNEQVELYLKQLNDTEKKALEIAIHDLQSSFDIEKSIGYTKWLKSQINEKKPNS
jgi:hypothetical protein